MTTPYSAKALRDLRLAYRSSELVSSYEEYDARSVQQWTVTATPPSDDVRLSEYGADPDDVFRLPPEHRTDSAPVAVFRFVKVSGESRENLLGILDDPSLGIEEAVHATFDFETGDLKTELEDRLEEYKRFVLFGNGMRLHPDWRGRGVGRYLVARAILYLAEDCRCVAFHPSPYMGQKDLSESSKPEITKKLAATWRAIGFKNFRGGVMVLDPALGTLGEWVRKFEHRHGIDR